MSGAILAAGLSGGMGPSQAYNSSGGAVRLVANSLSVSGSIDTSGANVGMVRLEAPIDALSFTGYSTPPALISTVNPVLFATATPVFTIVSVGGFAVPAYAGNRKDAADIVLPSQLSDPINVVVQASNIPPGTPVDLIVGVGNGTTTPGVLAGSFQSSSATATVSGLTRANGSLTYLYVQAVFSVSQGTGGSGSANPPGPDQVAQVRVTAAPGVRPTYAFLRVNGTEIATTRLSQAFLEQYR